MQHAVFVVHIQHVCSTRYSGVHTTYSGPKYRWRWDIYVNILAWKYIFFGFVFFHDVCDDLGHSKPTKTTRTDKAMTLLSSPEARANGARLVTVYVGGTSRGLF